MSLTPKTPHPLQTDLCLSYREVAPNRADVTTAAPVLIVLHGKYSHELDFYDCHPQLPPYFRTLFVRAPLTLQAASEHSPGAFYWFSSPPFSSDSRAQPRTQYFYGFDEAQAACARLLTFLQQVQAKYPVVGSHHPKLVLLGFSQGAMLTLALTRATSGFLAASVALSGCLLPELKLASPQAPPLPPPLNEVNTPSSASSTTPPLLLHHGAKDQVLPLAFFQETQAALKKLRIAFQSQTYPELAHDVSEQSFADVCEWLRLQVPPQADTTES